MLRQARYLSIRFGNTCAIGLAMPVQKLPLSGAGWVPIIFASLRHSGAACCCQRQNGRLPWASGIPICRQLRTTKRCDAMGSVGSANDAVQGLRRAHHCRSLGYIGAVISTQINSGALCCSKISEDFLFIGRQCLGDRGEMRRKGCII